MVGTRDLNPLDPNNPDKIKPGSAGTARLVQADGAFGHSNKEINDDRIKDIKAHGPDAASPHAQQFTLPNAEEEKKREEARRATFELQISMGIEQLIDSMLADINEAMDCAEKTETVAAEARSFNILEFQKGTLLATAIKNTIADKVPGNPDLQVATMAGAGIDREKYGLQKMDDRVIFGDEATGFYTYDAEGRAEYFDAEDSQKIADYMAGHKNVTTGSDARISPEAMDLNKLYIKMGGDFDGFKQNHYVSIQAAKDLDRMKTLRDEIAKARQDGSLTEDEIKVRQAEIHALKSKYQPQTNPAAKTPVTTEELNDKYGHNLVRAVPVSTTLSETPSVNTTSLKAPALKPEPNKDLAAIAEHKVDIAAEIVSKGRVSAYELGEIAARYGISDVDKLKTALTADPAVAEALTLKFPERSLAATYVTEEVSASLGEMRGARQEDPAAVQKLDNGTRSLLQLASGPAAPTSDIALQQQGPRQAYNPAA